MGGLVLFPNRPAIGQEKDWELKKDKDQIRIYTRKVPESDFREFRGITTVQAPVAAVVATLQDIDAYIEWMPDAIETRVLEVSADTAFIYYMATEAPWPVKNRDGIYQINFRLQGPGRIVLALADCMPDYLPVRHDFLRIRLTRGRWLLAPQPGGRTKVTYQVLAEPGGNVPAWLMTSTSVSLPFKTLTALQQQVLLDKYQNRRFQFLE